MQALQCNRCKKFEAYSDTKAPDGWLQLDYFSLQSPASIGYYHTIHLCKSCARLLDDFIYD